MAAITREQKIREHYAEAGFSAEQALALADGAIVGTSLKVDGAIQNPVDPARVRRLARRIKVLL